MSEIVPAKRTFAMLARVVATLVRRPRPRTFPSLTPDNFPALEGRLEVIRDVNGIAHVYAEEERDLYAALGYLQAADRLFFVDLIRHLGAGRLCELIGNHAAPGANELLRGKRVADVDKFVRPLGIEAQSRRDFARLDPRAARCLESFAAGFNAALRAMRGVYPPEYVALGAVRPWEPADCLLAAHACAFIISITLLENELAFDAARRRLGDDGARRLYPEAPWAEVPTTYVPGPAELPEVPLHVPSGGSNNWAVAPALSSSGAAIVANDPHVPILPLPTFWHHVHVDCPGYRVQGGTLPGCPAFVVAHNGSLAWGVTHAGRDTYDLYRIHRLAEDRTRYRVVDGVGTIERHRDEVRACRGPADTVEWEQCEHGIIYPGWQHHDGVDLALRVIPSDGARFFEGYLALAASRTVEQHREALRRIHEGPFDFNHVYGHKNGNIGWQLFGLVPRRRDGLFVRDAHDPQGQWDGFVPFDEMPALQDPADGFVATANSNVLPDRACVAFTAVHCEPPHRQRQIEAFLRDRRPHSPTTFIALQARVDSDYGPRVRDALVGVIGDSFAPESLAGRAARILGRWNGRFAAEESGASIFFCAQQGIAHDVFIALLGGEIGFRYINGPRAIPRLQRLLEDASDPLRGDLERVTGHPFRKLIRDAFSSAMARVARSHGGIPEDWQWGRLYRARLGTLISLVPVLGRAFTALDAPFYGDDHVVCRTHPVAIGRNFYGVVAASSRFICDLANPEEALFAHSSGPSADPHTTYFANLSADWHRFEYFRSALWKSDQVPSPMERLIVERRSAGGK